MALDPYTTRLGMRTAREVISGRHISYPVPYVLVILAALCVACLIIASVTHATVQVVALVLACAAVALTAAVLAVGLLFRPELLRSEQHHEVMRVLDMVGDSEMPSADRTRLATTVLKGRRGTRLGDHHE